MPMLARAMETPQVRTKVMMQVRTKVTMPTKATKATGVAAVTVSVESGLIVERVRSAVAVPMVPVGWLF